MKRYLLIIMMMVCASIGAWAQATFSADYKGAYITTNGAGNLTTSAIESHASHFQWVNYVIITGNINNSDVENLASASYTIDGNNMGGSTIDFSGAVGDVTFTAKSAFKGIKLPTGYDLASYSGPQTFAFYVDGSDVYLRILDSDNGLNDIKALSTSCSWANAPLAGKTVYLSGNYGDFDTAKAFLKGDNNARATEVIKVAPISNDPYTVDECTITINMAKAGSKTFTELLADAKAKMTEEDATQTSICTLIVQGTVSDTELGALNDANLSSATRIDLSGATIAAGSSINEIKLPSSIRSLVLPKDMTVTSTLANVLDDYTNLDYAYSPSSDCTATGPDQADANSPSTYKYDDSKNTIADYVWVNQAGGLKQAFENEEQLRNSFYIKVASSVALTETDVNFNGCTNKPTNYLFLDFSESNLTPTVAASYTVTDEIGYRIILPNGWTGDQMAVFAANPNKGSLAAVYSYNGTGNTRLDILEIKDGSYMQNALTNPRIVRSGTTAIQVLSGSYNGQTYSSFGTNLLAAINNMDNANSAGRNVRTVSISTGSNLPGNMEFSNTVITTLELKNVSYTWAVDLNVNACTSLQTLNLNYATLGNVTAQVSSLTSVDLSAATLTSVDLTGPALTTALTALTMDDDTNISGNMTLKSTGLTSFTPHGTVGGDIYLNASNNLASLDVRQFTQAANKKIHIDADATDESKAAVISGLDNGTNKTITVPKGYKSSERFHPYDAISDNIAEAAYVPPMYTTSTTTMMLHEKNANTDGDNYIYWYDDQDPNHQGNNVTIGTSTESGHSLAEILTSEASIGTTTYRRAKIDGPIASTDVDDLADINCQVLDLSSATFDATAWAALKTAFAKSGTGVHSSVRFVILPSNSTREDIINGTALAGLTNVLSVIALNKITGATDESDNGTNLTSWNRVSGALQAAVVAAGNHSCQSWTKTPDGKTSRNIYTSDISDFRECKISGLINSHDLSKGNQNLDANGHLSWDTEPVELSSGTDPRELNGTCTAYGPFSASFNLSVIDLQGAFFEEKGNNQGLAEKDKRYYFQDMTLSALGIISEGTYKVVVPTDPRAKEIPADFMNCSTKIRAICIPSNIVAIRTRAFYTIDYVWTTATNLADTEDPEGTNTRLDNGAKLKTADSSNFIETSALVYENGAYKENPAFTKKCYVADYSTKNGGGTYTFGSNLRLIETGAFANTQPNVKDVYVLNTKAPECHVDAFNTTMYAGNNGYSPISDGQTIISRENYFNSRWITMLHYPRQTTTPNVQRYTDPTREYSIATGERDGKGAPIYFPNQSEFIRAYNQGTYGYLWNAWNPTRDYGSVINPIVDANSGWDETKQAAANTAFNQYKSGTDHKYTSFYKVNWAGVAQSVADDDIVPYYEVNWDETSYSTVTTGGNLYPQSEIDAKSDADNSGEPTAKDYRGWHQFVLNAYAANTILDEEPYRSYITDDEWWTICPTFDITREECAILFGQAQGIHSSSPSKYPYVSKLRYVRRFYGDGKGTITLNFTENLAENKEDRSQPTDKHGRNNTTTGYVEILDGTPPLNSDVVMSAGVPYLIKPNMGASPKRQFRIFKTEEDLQSFIKQFTTDEWNNRNFVAFANESLYNKIKAAQAESGATQIQHIQDGMYTVPVFVSESNGSGLVKENVERVSGTPTPYHPTGETSTYYKSTDWVYTFVGTFYKSFLPHYCYYLGWDSSLNNGKGAARFFYLDGEKGKPGVFTYYDNNMNWNNETGVICPTFKNNGYTTAESRVFNHTVTPAADKTPAQWIITDLVSDSFTVSSGSQGAKTYEMVFGAPDMIADDSDVTGIENVNDDSNINNIEGNDINVYTINGQKVGTSLEDLPKGIYIVNGKKFIVK